MSSSSNRTLRTTFTWYLLQKEFLRVSPSITFLAFPLGVTSKADNLIIGRSADKLAAQRLAAIGTGVALFVVALALTGDEARLCLPRANDSLVTANALCCLVFCVARLAVDGSSRDEEWNSFESDVAKSAPEAGWMELSLHCSQNPVKKRKFAMVAFLPGLLVIVLA